MVSDNEPLVISNVWKNVIKQLAIKHRFTSIYKPSINGLVEWTIKTLRSMITNETETMANAND